MTWTEYHDLRDIDSYSAYLADFYDFVSLKTIGKSYEGRTMKVVQVSRSFLIYIEIYYLILSEGYYMYVLDISKIFCWL